MCCSACKTIPGREYRDKVVIPTSKGNCSVWLIVAECGTSHAGSQPQLAWAFSPHSVVAPPPPPSSHTHEHSGITVIDPHATAQNSSPNAYRFCQ